VDDIYFEELRRSHRYDGLEEDICIGEELLIAGPAGAIEVLTAGPARFDPTLPIAVVCHPHPLYGGSLSNKVVHILAESFNAMGLLSVSFNFRGVGRSEGRFDRGVGETADLLAVIEWFRNRYPEAPIWLAGFSFGSYVAARAHREGKVERLLLVAPPVKLFDFTQLPEIRLPWMVIQGGRDEITEPQAVSAWVHQQRCRPAYEWMADADHFFHGRMNRLRETLVNAWSEAVRVRVTDGSCG
jgi:alpha/beta superfamily hydrolase